jgi:RimJ/RimL family protein N-acetyltransferase
MTEDGLRPPSLRRAPAEIETERLRLRQWTEEDRAPFAAMNADPRVMEHFPKLLTREESDAHVDRIEASFQDRGFGLWVLELKQSPGFLGFVGLGVPRFAAPFMPCVEIGWRLTFSAWGHGYATEAARACLETAFDVIGLTEVLSFTATSNVRSQKVMQRIGMHHDPAGDFDHPVLPSGHPLQRHVLYRASQQSERGASAP